ncbi:protein RALF-like 32 [Gastrolobium bilobum]|uniref:protein RALF-like 32 n=1 Tax=Gastrolobium bilobum TaxID=150636 RepID=UPI002AB15489|nr:protein RALF-like 32 [Gastrolobium bilobum]
MQSPLATFLKGAVIYYYSLYYSASEWKGTSKTHNTRMASKSTIRLLSLCYFMLFSFMHFNRTVFSWTSHESTCNGSIAECNEEDEMLMESEISRRFLEQKRYISDGALKRDKPVCNGGATGEAYSKTGGCLPPPANPYNRGCSKYYRCRSDS